VELSVEQDLSETRLFIGLHTGETHTIYWHGEARCWTYRDVRGCGPGLGSCDARHPTPEAAVEACRLKDIVRAAQGDGTGLSREGYEQRVAELGLRIFADDEMGYGVRYGDYSWPEYSPEHCAAMVLARRRLTAMDEETCRAVDARRRLDEDGRGVARKAGQLYEPCPRCGREPVYMPLHLCEDCWPR
jgi:hypothetical protein